MNGPSTRQEGVSLRGRSRAFSRTPTIPRNTTSGSSPYLQQSPFRTPGWVPVTVGEGVSHIEEVVTGPREEISREKERQIKKNGVLLASAGLGLALLCLVYFRLAGLTVHGSIPVLGGLAGLTALVQAVLWWIPHRGWDRKLTADPDYVYVPLAAAALLLSAYIATVPEARDLLLIGWFAALMFGLRFLGFWDVIAFGILIVASYGVALSIHAGDPAVHDMTWQVEGTRGAVVLAIHVFAAGLFERVRRDRKEKEALRDRLAEESITDPLTGLYNRRYLRELLDSEINRSHRYDWPCSMTMIDLDHFKQYNDAHGHPAGDQVLQRVADVLRSEARDSDVVARYGGEEFATVMPNTDWEEARAAAERLRDAVEQESVDGEEVLPEGLTVSVGVASYPEFAGSAEDLLQAADRALYQAKGRGRNRVVGAVREGG